MKPQVQKCRSCGADIIWVLVEGKSIPLNARRVRGYQLVENQLKDAVASEEPMYISHFITCPDASEWPNRLKKGAQVK